MSEAPAHSPVPALKAGQSLVAREEKIEYRDQDGNLLDPEQVKSLEGKVSFQTRYETRTRMVDAQGNVINPLPGEPESIPPVAPPHPDVNNVDQETIKVQHLEGPGPAIQKDINADMSKEESLEEAKTPDAKPAGEVNAATNKR